ncbi:MAG: 1-acyl-sn-glycerol-3-phosphate acyltransferase [Saprospiraceae bacterium]
MSLRKRISTWIFNKKWGWSTEGPLPYDVPKCLVVVYPHTSNWDFPIGVFFRIVYGIDIGFVGKHTLFKPPLGWLMTWLGGKGVVRTGNTNFVDGVAKIFEENETFRLCLTPEGTRSKPEKIKSGFHYMALAAKVPIVWCGFDWENKVMKWSAPYEVTEDYEETQRAFNNFFRGVKGHTPELAYDIPEE